MIGEVVLHVHKVAIKFDPDKAKESTWVYRVADNRCKGIVSHHRLQRYELAETVELTPELEVRLRTASTLERREAVAAVEGVLSRSGRACQALVAAVLEGRKPGKSLVVEAAGELRVRAWHAGATCWDFEQVLRFAVQE